MTSLRGLWKDCDEWDRRYQQEIDRTNMGSTGMRQATTLGENEVDPGAASTARGPADTLNWRDRR